MSMFDRQIYNPSTQQVVDLTDYAKLAIPTTQDNLYTNLIANSLLIPNQWYLITDFKGKYQVINAPTGTYHTGLIATWNDAYGNATTLKYDDNTDITDGDPEEIYLLASSINTFYPIGHSKTFKDEQITFEQNPTPVLGYGSIGTYGQLDPSIYINGSSDGGGGLINNYSEFTLDSIIDDSSVILGGTKIADFANRIINGSFYLNLYNSVTDTTLTCYDYNEGVDWSFDPLTNTLTDLTGTMQFTDFLTNSGCSWDGAFMYVELFTGVVTDPPISNYYPDIQVIEVINQSNIVLGGTLIAEFNNLYNNGNSFMYAGNDVLGSYVEYYVYDRGATWDFNPSTNTFTDLTGNIDFRYLSSNYCYMGGGFNYILEVFKGHIVERFNTKISYREPLDYRSNPKRRFRSNLPAYVSGGTTNIGQIVKYGQELWKCVRTTTSAPNYNEYWVYLGIDNYLFTADLSQGPYAITIDTSNFIDNISFNMNDLITIVNPVNTTVTGKIYEQADVIFYSSISNISNVILSGKLTIIGGVIRSQITGTNSIIGDLQDTSIKNATSSIIVQSNYSDIVNISYSTIRQLVSSQIFQMSACQINQILYSTVFGFYNSFANVIQQSNISYVNNAYFAGTINNNPSISAIVNCNFYSNCSNNVLIAQITNCNFTYLYGNIVTAPMDYIENDGTIQNNRIYSSIAGLNATGNYTHAQGNLHLNMSNCTVNDGIYNWKGTGLISLSKVTNNGVLSNLTFNDGGGYGQTSISDSTLSGFNNTVFATKGGVGIVGLTTTGTSGNNHFDNLVISGSKIGNLGNNTFGDTNKPVVIQNCNIDSGISNCNADYITIGAIKSLGITSLTVSGGDSNTRISNLLFSSNCGSLTLGASSQVVSSVFNGNFSNVTIGANSQITRMVNNGDTWLTMAPNTYIQYSTFNGINNCTINHGINSCNFLSFWPSQTTTAPMSGTTYIGNVSTDIIEARGRLLVRTVTSDPQDATPANRPAGSIPETVYYSGNLYFCTNAGTPTWKKVTAT